MEGQKLLTLVLMAILVSGLVFISGCVQEEKPTTIPASEKVTPTEAPTITQPSETLEKEIPTTTPPPHTVTLEENWQVIPISVNTFPDSEKGGHDKITFTLLFENIATKPLLLKEEALEIGAKYDSYSYVGKFSYIEDWVPPGYRVLAEASVQVPSQVVTKAKYKLNFSSRIIDLPAPPFEILVPTWQPPDAKSWGETLTVEGHWSITPKNIAYPRIIQEITPGNIRMRVKLDIQYIIENLYGYPQDTSDSVRFLISRDDGIVFPTGMGGKNVPPFGQATFGLTINPKIEESGTNQQLIVIVTDRENRERVLDYSAWSLSIPNVMQPQIWVWEAPTGIYDPLIVSADAALIYSGDILTALNVKNGKVMWSRNSVSGFSPVVADGSNVYFREVGNGRLISIDLSTGETKWKSAEDVNVFTVGHGRAYIKYESNRKKILSALDAESGKVLWSKELDYDYKNWLMAGQHGVYIEESSRGPPYKYLTLFDRSTGEFEGRFYVGKFYKDEIKAVVQGKWVYSSSTYGFDKSIPGITSSLGGERLIAAQDGTKVLDVPTWFEFPGKVSSISSGPVNFMLVGGGGETSLFGVASKKWTRAYKGDGEVQQVWESEYLGELGPNAWDKDTLYFTGERLRAIDLYTGREKWSIGTKYRSDFESYIPATYVAVHNNILFVAVSNRTYALDLDIIRDELLPPSSASTVPEDNDIELLAKVIASEAGSVYDRGTWVKCTETERTTVSWTVLNRLKVGYKGATTIEGVITTPGQYAYGQTPTPEIRELAKWVLEGKVEDPTGGATHFFSPISMPWEGDEGKYIERLKSHFNDFDTEGGLHEVPGISKKVYFPSWTKTHTWIGDLNNVRRAYFIFYRAD